VVHLVGLNHLLRVMTIKEVVHFFEEKKCTPADKILATPRL